jgi:hypothetical protein
MSTVATLLVIPSIFALVIGSRVARSPSIYPDDRESRHYDPDAFSGVNEMVNEARSEPPSSHMRTGDR